MNRKLKVLYEKHPHIKPVYICAQHPCKEQDRNGFLHAATLSQAQPEASARKLAGIKIAVDTLRLAWRYNPLLLATGTAALMLAPGLAIATWVGYRYIFLGVSHFVWGIIAIVLTAVGFIALLLAMLTIYLKHMELRIMRTIQALRDQLLSQQTPHRAVPQPKELD